MNFEIWYFTLSGSSSSTVDTSPSSSVVSCILVSRLLASIKVRKLSSLKCLRCEHTECSTMLRTDLTGCLWAVKHGQYYMRKLEKCYFQIFSTCYCRHFIFNNIPTAITSQISLFHHILGLDLRQTGPTSYFIVAQVQLLQRTWITRDVWHGTQGIEGHVQTSQVYC